MNPKTRRNISHLSNDLGDDASLYLGGFVHDFGSRQRDAEGILSGANPLCFGWEQRRERHRAREIRRGLFMQMANGEWRRIRTKLIPRSHIARSLLGQCSPITQDTLGLARNYQHSTGHCSLQFLLYLKN